MPIINSPIPSISISPPPPAEPVIEPYSPFLSWNPSLTPVDDEGFRSHHLTPPPTITKFSKSLSPLRPAESPLSQGVERERFEAMLQTARERNMAVGAKKAQDLRKEIALKAHKNKQVERRALFLSKIQAPPSPTATLTPKTPPESPAIFHYSLPSPGLVSPLSLFESLCSGDPAQGAFLLSQEPWVEQVDFRLLDAWKPKDSPKPSAKPRKLGKPIPSLDQITARLSTQGQISPPPEGDDRAPSTRLPAFLRAPVQPASSEAVVLPKPVPIIGLQVSCRSEPESDSPTEPDSVVVSPPNSPVMPKLQITTLVVPRTPTTSQTPTLSESNLLAFNSHRERTSKDMLLTLERRTASRYLDAISQDGETEDRKSRRLSSPADLPHRQRTGFEHPVLSMPGGF
jgi:hypothetical protein